MSSTTHAITLSAGALVRRCRYRRAAMLLASIALLAVCAAGTAQGDVWSAYRQAAEARIATWEARRPGILVSGAYMVDLRTDEVILDVRSQDMLITASNMKLFTGAFALSKLGPSFAFTTKVYLVGNDIVVIGDGDPTIGCEDLSAAAGETVYTELDRWADAIKTQAQPQFTGDLLLCSRFDLSGFHHPNKSNTTNPAWYSAPVDALNFHDNYYDVTFTVAGDTVTPNLVPASSFMQVINQLTRGSPSSWTLRSASDESTVTLSGRVPSSTTSASWVSGNHPAMLLGRTLADRIVLAGVPFSGAIQMVQFGDLDLSGAQLLYQRDTALADSMKRMNKRSLNMAANCHFLRAGDGTWAGSQALITTSMLDDYTLDPSGFNIIEGSGLFETCRAKPRVFVDLLTQMTEHPDGNILVESLPISGVDGTLQEQGRYPEAEYRARVLGKTGTVGSASCLSGYILDAETSEPVVAFSILCNRTEWFSGYTWWNYAREMQDDIAKMLVDTVDALSDDEPPTITAWYSAGDHARGVGEALLEIPDDGSFCEPRSSGISRLIVQFSEALDPVSFAADRVLVGGLDSNNAPVDLSAVVVSTSMRDGDTVGVIEFDSALPDFARYTVLLYKLTDTAGNTLTGDRDRTMTALEGDVSGDSRVNASDLSRVRSERTSLIDPNDPAQVRADVTSDGRINATDLSRVRARRGNDAREIEFPVVLEPGVYIEKDGLVEIEAENFFESAPQGGHSWDPVSSPDGYSGDGAMRALPDSGTRIDTGYVASSPRLDFRVTFQTTGTWYIWVRGYSFTPNDDDSCHAGLNGQAVPTCDRIGDIEQDQWVWENSTRDGPVATMDIPDPGDHTINLWMREDGFVIDRIVMTTNPNYTPDGTSPQIRHPIVLFDPDDLDMIRERLTRGMGPMIMDHLRQSAEARSIVHSGLYSILTDDPSYAQNVISSLINRANQTPGTAWLSNGGQLYEVAMGYDVLYNYMTPSQRNTVRARIEYLSRNIYDHPMTHSSGNWLPHVWGSLSFAGYALEAESPNAESWIQRGREVNLMYLDTTFDPEGADTEALCRYFAMGMEKVLMMIGAERHRGTDYTAYRDGLLDKVVEFAAYMLVPYLHQSARPIDWKFMWVPYDDSFNVSTDPVATWAAIAGMTGNELAQHLFEVISPTTPKPYVGNSVLAAAYYDPNVPASGPVDHMHLPLAKAYWGISGNDEGQWSSGHVSMRTGFADKESVIFSAQCGDTGGWHGHADPSSFFLSAYGDQLVMD